MKFDFSYTFDALPRLLEGAMITVEVALLSFALSLTLATVLTVVRNLEIKTINVVIAVYISFIRGTPVLIQIFLAFYVLPLVGIDLPAFAAGILAVTLNSCAYTMEILRGGLASVPKGQLEAARALGLKSGTVWLKVILPQAYIATKEIRSQRELLRYYMSLVRLRTSIKNRIHAILAKNNIHHGFSDLFGKAGMGQLPWQWQSPGQRRIERR